MKFERAQKDVFITFDIETTTIYTGTTLTGEIQRDAIIYSGQFYDGTDYVQYRSLAEVVAYFSMLKVKYNTAEKGRVMVFVHFLSYEFQFIKSFFTWEKVLCRDDRRIIAAQTPDFIFRCSFFLSNMSLRKFLESEEVPEEYQKSNMDFSIRRYPWTELTDDEKRYMRNDVVGLHLALSNRIRQCRNEDLNFLPYTSTGYVRRMCRKAMFENKRNILDFREDALTIEQFNLIESAFRGGNTHCNRYRTGQVIRNVHSIDIASSYPFEMLTKKYPMKFYPLKSKTLRDFHLFKKLGYALVFTLTCKDIRIKENVYVPYIPVSKCRMLDKSLLQDNGRVLAADYLQTDICEIDYDIILQQYDFSECKISNVFIAKKKELPFEFRNVVKKLFYDKCILKGKDPYFYGRSKALLNSMYGLLVTNPCKPDYIYSDASGELVALPMDKESKLLEYYYSRLSFLSYQHGVYVTAYARQSLQEMIDLIGSDFVYCDTDSVKFTNYDAHMSDIDALNARKRAENDEHNISVEVDEHNISVEVDGKAFYMGIFEYEGCSDKFKSFGAKKYISGSDDDFSITIAGVPKKAGHDSIAAAVRSGRLQSPFDIDIGFSFDAIKSTMQYNDYQGIRKEIQIDGHELIYTDNIAAYDCNYTLGYSRDYEMLMRFIENDRQKELFHDIL